jgi:CRP/FNR family transcriptional regulator
VKGRVKLFCTSRDGAQTLIRVVCPEQFFGEFALVPSGDDDARESAMIIESSQLMSWTPDEIERQVEREPMLGLALCEYFATNNLTLQDRLASMAFFKTGTRVTISLVQLSRSVGVKTPDGALRIHGLTHQSIADYVGTSREIVTSEMNRLRRLGYLAYSRRYLDVYADALSEWLRQQETLPSLQAAESFQATT